MLKKVVWSFLVLSCMSVLSVIGLFYYYFPRGSIVLQPIGGMGNQLFQYAAAYSLAQSTDSKLYVIIDRSSETKGNISTTDRNSALTQFDIPKEHIIYDDYKIATSFIKLFTRTSRINKFLLITDVAEENFMTLNGTKNTKSMFMRSFFESEVFFSEHKDEVRHIFDLDKSRYAGSMKGNESIEKTISQLQQENSVCVHVRRRDFGELHYMSIKYQQKAMELAQILIPNPQFYIFSDDIEEVKYELEKKDNITYVSRADSLPMEDFYLMGKCANNINANSTFSWWSSYLNKKYDRLVIQPYPRIKDIVLNEKIDNKENFYAWKSLVYGRSDPVNWVLLTYNQRSLSAASKGVISDEKHAEIFKDYKDLSFYIYSGDLAQIDLCDKGDFRHGLCFLNGENSPKPTVVTAYYKNLYDSDLKAVSDFLHAPFNLVVFTDKENIDWLRKERGNLPMKIIEKECESFYHSKFLKTYERDYEQDVNKSNSPELYVLSAEKVKFVNQAIDMDPYDSDYFVWCDIDTFRESGYINNNFLSSKFMWKGRMGFAIIEEFTLLEMAEKIPTIQEPKAKASTRNYAIHSVARVAGNVQVGDIAAWRVYNEVWDITRDDMIDNGIHTSNDQRVMGAIALRYPWLVRLEYVDLGMTGK